MSELLKTLGDALSPTPVVEDYYKIDRLSNSSMKWFEQSPRHYLYNKLNPEKPTPAMIFGNVFHCLILEPDKFKPTYAVTPVDAPKRPSITQRNAKKPSVDTVKAIEYWDAYEKSCAGKIQISKADEDLANRMRDALEKHEPAWELISRCAWSEKALLWTDPETGVQCKGKLDGGSDDFTLDFKTCADAKPETIAGYAFSNRWPNQGAFYVDARGILKMKKGDFYFIAIEKDPPFGISVNKCSRDFIEYGRQAYTRIIEDYAHWRNVGSPDVDYQWTAQLGYHSLGLPPWVR